MQRPICHFHTQLTHPERPGCPAKAGWLAFLKHETYPFLLQNKTAMAESSMEHSLPCRPSKGYAITNLEKTVPENRDTSCSKGSGMQNGRQSCREQAACGGDDGSSHGWKRSSGIPQRRFNSRNREKDFCSASRRRKGRERKRERRVRFCHRPCSPTCLLLSLGRAGNPLGERRGAGWRAERRRRESTRRVNFVLPLETVIPSATAEVNILSRELLHGLQAPALEQAVSVSCPVAGLSNSFLNGPIPLSIQMLLMQPS